MATVPSPLERAHARSREGSRARQIIDLIWQLSNEVGRGVTVVEIREAFPRLTGAEAPSSLTSEVHSLKKRGVVDVTGGRVGHLAVVLSGCRLKGDPEHDEGLQVLEAVRAGWKRLGHPMSTRMVTDEVRRLGHALPSNHPNGVRKRLETLASVRTRGPDRRQEPLVRKIKAKTATGAPATFWLPRNARWEGSDLPARSSDDWIRRASAEAYSELQAPVSRSHLRWWYDQLPRESVLRYGMRRDRIGVLFSKTIETDTRHQGSPGRLHVVTTQFTCHGGAPVRVTVDVPTRLDRVMAHVTDVIEMLRVPDELEGIGALRSRANLLDDEVLRGFADLREEILAWTMSEAVGDFDPDLIRARLEDRRSLELTWLETSSLSENQREYRVREMAARAPHLEAFEEVMKLPRPSRSPAFRVGQGSLFNIYQLDAPIRSTLALLDIHDGKGSYLIANARRFPPSKSAGAERIGPGEPGTLALVDRVDAVSELLGAIAVARAGVLLEQAELVLGTTLRDVRPLLSALGERHTLRPMTRQAVVVALGWLGISLPFEEAVLEPSSYEDVSAWVLSTVLANWDTAEERLEAVQELVDGPGMEVVGTALMRLRMGGLLTVVG